jgi:glycerophosphoryl diester phosphodiesterase
MEEWHRRGLRVAVWTVDDAERARELERMGVSYLITNKPRALREALRGKAA